ncbi:MAG: 23S rRNA (uracil(1939)-C(5))-methyltransferase RlmD [Bulleidia sp.]|nr:23S rRNA (uracil(1939)-C(5))-methyltransferase RlmD [Bulleidia sp.]
MRVEFKKLGINGEGIGYVKRKPIFCDGVLPNEIADVEIIDEKPRYAIAKLKKLITKSKERIDSPSPLEQSHGCPLFIMDYQSQLVYKQQLLEESLYKYANVKRTFVRSMHASEKQVGYRSQCKLPVQKSHDVLINGMYEPKTNHFHPIDYFIIHDDKLEVIRHAILDILNDEHYEAYSQKTQKGLRYIVLRHIQDQAQCTLITGKETIPASIINRIMSISNLNSLSQSINTDRKSNQIFGSPAKILAGDPALTIQIDQIKVQLSPESFFQLNVDQAEKMYQMAISKIDTCKVLVEAYCGIGTMALMAKDKAQVIYGIEYNASAIKNAKSNAELNHIKNTEFICADAAKGLQQIANKKTVDCLLVDPPRSGMDEAMLSTILKVLPKKIVYISCNPATLAKNLKQLKQRYHVVTIIPYDLFPQTPLVEAITVLELG